MQRRSQHTSLITGAVYYPACVASSGVRQELVLRLVLYCPLKDLVRRNWLGKAFCDPSMAVVFVLTWRGRDVTGVESCRAWAVISKQLGLGLSGS